MFEGWDSYFLLLGGAAGALIGLLFVVAGLTSSLDREARLRGASLYLSPVVFHFAVVVVVSAAALEPRLHPSHLAAIVGVCALTGAIHLGFVTAAIGSRKTPAPPHWSDIWCYGLAPLALYLALAGAAAASALRLSWAAYAVAAASLALLLIGIRNAWDLVTWLAPAATGPEPRPPANDVQGR
jgi:hypothetical protein